MPYSERDSPCHGTALAPNAKSAGLGKRCPGTARPTSALASASPRLSRAGHWSPCVTLLKWNEGFGSRVSQGKHQPQEHADSWWPLGSSTIFSKPRVTVSRQHKRPAPTGSPDPSALAPGHCHSHVTAVRKGPRSAPTLSLPQPQACLGRLGCQQLAGVHRPRGPLLRGSRSVHGGRSLPVLELAARASRSQPRASRGSRPRSRPGWARPCGGQARLPRGRGAWVWWVLFSARSTCSCH